MYRMELCCRDDLCEFFHVDGFYIDNICWLTESLRRRLTKALIGDVEVPQVDPQVIR